MDDEVSENEDILQSMVGGGYPAPSAATEAPSAATEEAPSHPPQSPPPQTQPKLPVKEVKTKRKNPPRSKVAPSKKRAVASGADTKPKQEEDLVVKKDDDDSTENPVHVLIAPAASRSSKEKMRDFRDFLQSMTKVMNSILESPGRKGVDL
nr:hypothetical protein TetV2_00070 [Oceanusvirus sp.]